MARIHVIGSGVAGLAAAARGLQLGADVVIYDAAPDIGGRLRSMNFPGLSRLEDMSWPVLHGGDAAVRGLIDLIGAGDQWQSTAPDILFHEAPSAKQWRFRPRSGVTWTLNPAALPPDVRPWHFLELFKLRAADMDETVSQALRFAEQLTPRLLSPLCRLLLNCSAQDASPHLFRTELKKFMFGSGAPMALVPKTNLHDALARPALAWLARNGLEWRRHLVLTDLDAGASRVDGIFFGNEHLELDEKEGVILALPLRQMAEVLPELGIAPRMTPSVLVHFHDVAPCPSPTPQMLCVCGGPESWAVWQENRISVLFPDARSIVADPKQQLAEFAWRVICPVINNGQETPQPESFAVVKERRATIAHTPGSEQTRPGVATVWDNLALASGGVVPGAADRFDGSASAGVAAMETVLSRLGAM